MIWFMIRIAFISRTQDKIKSTMESCLLHRIIDEGVNYFFGSHLPRYCSHTILETTTNGIIIQMYSKCKVDFM